MVNEQEHGHPSPRHLALREEGRRLPVGNIFENRNRAFGPLSPLYLRIFCFSFILVILAIGVVGGYTSNHSCVKIVLDLVLNVVLYV